MYYFKSESFNLIIFEVYVFHSANSNKTNYISAIFFFLEKDILVGKKLFETPADSSGELHPGCPYQKLNM